MLFHSPQRVAASLHLSDEVYEAAHAPVGNETRDRQTMRLAITTLGYLLRWGEEPSQAGDVVHAILLSQLAKGGITPTQSVYSAWPRYESVVARLPHAPVVRMGGDLTEFANAYADVDRRTMNRDGSYESDASHVFHSLALALPYAAENYPELDQGKLAAYLLVHDAPERFAGDTPTLVITPEELEEKYAREQDAMVELKAELANYPELYALIEQYEHQRDAESRFARTWDKHDTGFTHFLNNGSSLRGFHDIQTIDRFYELFEEITARMTYGADFPRVMADRATLLDEVAATVFTDGDEGKNATIKP